MTDLIDRQALLQALCNEDGTQHEYCYPCKAVLDVVNALPSAQPEKRTDKRTETHACDCISRQAAIDALIAEINEKPETYWDSGLNMYDVESVLKGLPSAQPYTEAEIQKMQELEQAEIQKAYELGKQDAQHEIIRCKYCGYWGADPSCSAFPNLHLCRYWMCRITTDAEDFCGRAERRNDATD